MKIAIIGAGPGGLYAAYELVKNGKKDITVFDEGNILSKRKCPISEKRIECAKCNPCSIMNGFGGAGAFSDGKFNITNDFGGNLYEKIGYDKSLELQGEVDNINHNFLETVGFPKIYFSVESKYKKICLQNNLHLLRAGVRHLGTDKNYIILEKMYDYLVSNGVQFYFNTKVISLSDNALYYIQKAQTEEFKFDKAIIAVGRSGSKWLQKLCEEKHIPAKSNKVDIGVRVEIPYEVFSSLTDKLYEAKILYKTKKYEDYVRTFCMNPKGIVVNENINGLITVNGHSFEDSSKHTNNTNFALLVSQHFTEPFKNSNEYGEAIVKLSNMLGNGVLIQRFGDLIRCKRTTNARLKNNSIVPTLKAEPGDLSLVFPKRIIDDIIEMIYALDKVTPGIANDDTLLYGVEVKYYNNEIEVDNKLKVRDNLYIIGDCSGVTHSLSQAAASGLFVAKDIIIDKK